MPTQAITTQAFMDALAACADAVTSEDWPTAQKQLAIAELVNAGLDLEASQRGVGNVEIVRRRLSLHLTAELVEKLRLTILATSGGRRIITTRTNSNGGPRGGGAGIL